jgi:hypothetical protein
MVCAMAARGRIDVDVLHDDSAIRDGCWRRTSTRRG